MRDCISSDTFFEGIRNITKTIEAVELLKINLISRDKEAFALLSKTYKELALNYKTLVLYLDSKLHQLESSQDPIIFFADLSYIKEIQPLDPDCQEIIDEICNNIKDVISFSQNIKSQFSLKTFSPQELENIVKKVNNLKYSLLS